MSIHEFMKRDGANWQASINLSYRHDPTLQTLHNYNVLITFVSQGCVQDYYIRYHQHPAVLTMDCEFGLIYSRMGMKNIWTNIF